MLEAPAQVVFLLGRHLREGLVLQLDVGDTLAAVKLAEVTARSANAHELLDASEGVEGDRARSELKDRRNRGAHRW